MLRNIEITVEKIPHNGILVLTTLYEGTFYTQRYLDYTVHEAKASFLNYVYNKLKGQDNEND